MRTSRLPDPRVCSIEAALAIVGEKWALLAVREIAFGQSRFDDIAFNTGAARDILSTRLKSLENAGIVERRSYHERPVRYEYHLTEAGAELVPILYAVSAWGDKFARTDPENIVIFRHSCGAKLVPAISCSECGESLRPEDVTADREMHRSDLVVRDGNRTD